MTYKTQRKSIIIDIFSGESIIAFWFAVANKTGHDVSFPCAYAWGLSDVADCGKNSVINKFIHQSPIKFIVEVMQPGIPGRNVKTMNEKQRNQHNNNSYSSRHLVQ